MLQQLTIKNNIINVQGYAVRAGVNGSNGGNITLNENTLKTDNTEGDPVIELRGTVVALNMEKNVVSGNTHIKGTAGTISVDANYWDGKEAPVVPEGSAPIVVNSYYSDEALTTLVRIPMGNDFTAYTREDAIWGEVGGNAIASFVIKVLDADENVMGTTSLNNVGGIIDGSVYVTWSLKLDAESNQDEYWTMQWTTAPSIDNMPAKVELWVDGEKVSGGDVVLNAPDNLKKINAANIDVNGKILAYRTTLTEAVNNSDNVAILTAGTYDVPTGKDLTITGAVDGVVFDNIDARDMGGASVTFNNVTFNYAADSHYKGLQHAGDMVYNNCTFNGQVFLYGESETFNNCTFKQEDSNNYNVWTYGAKEVAFNGCTFNSAGKSVLIYKENTPGFVANVSVDKCEFNATTAVEGKAAIEMDSSLIGGINLTIDSEDTPEEDRTTATGFGSGNVSHNSLWNNKMGNNNDANNDITVVVAGETVLEPIYVAKIGEEGHRTLQEAINASQDNDEIVLLDNVTDVDATISKKVTLNLNEKTITDAYIIITSEVNIKGGSIKNVNEPYPLVVQNGGKLTVDGVGIEASKSDRAIWVRNGSELVFNNSSILATKGEGNNKTSLIAAIYTDSNTDVTINSGTITVDTPDNKAVAIFGNYVNANVTVNGGKISTSGKNYSYGINVDGDITVTGGEIVTNEKGYAYSSGIRYGYNYALVTATGNVTITGGKITTNGFSGYAVNVGRTYSSNDQTVSITGGTFTNNLSEVEMTAGGHKAPVLVWTGTASTVTATIENGNFSGYNANLFRKDNEEDNSTLEVSGGTFDREINGEYLAGGYAITANENGTYGVSLADYVTFPEGVTAENYKEKFGDNTVTDGTNYYATMTAALNAVYGTETTLYCKPGANVGQMTHGAIKETLTVYGNDAYTSGNGDFDIGNCNYEGKEITSDITLTVKHLDGCGAWGYKNTEHTINIVFENCKDMSEVYLSGTAGRTNITMTNCEFTDNVDGGNCKVYSNADGTITLKDMLFSGVDKAVNFNHKATGTQTIALENCTFTNCGDDVAGDEIPVRVLSSVAGGNSVLTVTDCTFSGTPEGGADILLDYGVGLTEATVSNTAAKVVVEKENNVGETTIVAANETKSFVNLVPVAKIGDAVYYTFEDAIAAAVADASITSIEILRDYTQTYYIEAGKTYSILENQNLTVVAPEGKSYTITLDRTAGETFSIYHKSAKSSLTIAENVTIEGLEILANGFATSENNTTINGTLKALSLKQWTSNGTITVSETGKVWLGYGDGQFDLAYGNGAVVINGNGDKTEAQFKAGYSGTRGNGNTLTLNDTYFEAGAWFNLNGSNGTININNSLLKVSGGDAAGKMTIKAGNVVYVNEGGTLECAIITLEEGAKIVVNGGTLKAKTVTNNGEIAVLGESTLNIETHTGKNIDFLDGAIVNNSTVGGEAFVAGNVTFRGDNTFAMLYDYGTLTDYYGTTAPMKWNVEKGASVTLTNKARYGLGYGDEVTVIGNIENALTARENLSDDDRSLFMHGLVAQESLGWNCNSALNVENAYVVLGSNNSFGNKSGNYGGNYTINFKNSVVDASRITFYEALSTTTFTFEGSDVKMGTFMTRDADSKFTLKDSKVLSTTTTNGTDEGNYNAGELVLENSSLTYSAAVINTGTIEIGAASTLTAPAVTNEGTINFTALDSKLVTATEGLTIKLDEAYPDHKVVYKDVAYVVVEKVYVAKIGEQGYESFAEALDAVENGETIELLGTEGSEISKEIDFTEDIEFTITGNAPNYGLPIVTFQNATVNIKDATILIPELDARQDATINVINSTVYDAGGNSIAKSYYNGAINIDAESTVYTMQVTTMGYITVAGTLNATWQTNVYGNGLITLNEGAIFNTAALHLTAKDYEGRDNTDAGRVGQPAEIVVDGANFTVGKVLSAGGADYSYNSSKGINVGTVDGKSAILNIKNGGNVNIYMANGETANIGAGGTVKVDASTLNTICRSAEGTVTLANNGTVNVTGNASMNVTTTADSNPINFTDVTIANANIGGAVNAFRTNNFTGTTNIEGILSVGYYGSPAEQVVVNITGNFNGGNVLIGSSNDNVLNVGNAEGEKSTAYFGQIGAFGDVNIVNSDVTYHYAFVRNEFNVTNSTMEIKEGGVNTYFAGNAKVVLDNTTWNLPGFANIGSYGEYNYGNADVTLKNGSVMSGTNLGIEVSGDYEVKVTLEDNSRLEATNLTNQGSIVLDDVEAKVTSNEFDNAPTTTVAYHKVNYVDGSYVVVAKDYVAQIYDVNNNTNDDRRYETLQEALNAAQDGETIKLIADEIFTEDNRTNSSGTWYEGVYYVGDKNFTIDLAGHTITQDGSVNDYLLLFKNNGEKDNIITLKNGTIDAGDEAYCAFATTSSNVNKMTINTEDINFVGNNSNGAVLKIRGGAELNVKAGTEITGEDSYVGIECYGATVNIYDGAEIYQNGTTSYNGCLVGVSGNGTVNVYGGYGKGVSGGFIAMTSGGTINVYDGEWIANTDGTYANSNKSVLVAQSADGASSIVNVSGGVFKGGYNCYGDAAGDAQINISGGIFSEEPVGFIVDGYKAYELPDSRWSVRLIAGTQTREFASAGWYWFSTYIQEMEGPQGLDNLKEALNGKAIEIKSQHGFTHYYPAYQSWTSGLTSLSTAEMYMIQIATPVTVELDGNFVEYENRSVSLYEGWNWIGYPVNEEVDINIAFMNHTPMVGDILKGQNETSVYYEGFGWFPTFNLKPGYGYMYKSTQDATFTFNIVGNKNTNTDVKTVVNNYHWNVDPTQYPNNMTVFAMVEDVEGDDYEVAALVNGEVRGSARPVYFEPLNAYILVLTISGNDVEEMTFMYYDNTTGEEVEFSNRINYSSDAVVGSIAEPYMLTRGTTGIGEAEMSQVNIYPNPTTTGTEINLQATCDKVEVFNALGAKVAEYQNVDSIDALETAGIYVIRITNDSNVQNCKLVVR